ncbi:Regulator of chromosome condensation (RCC1) repeat [Carpediemonas membranifera]|uniref:Regulator of chromosome condensation (RCC1) repeat n=1 Tax=Carpediemonas membranifera TaxID=201153 RepID=A0A8J6AZK1_9EUKA|nr:Regulator of chromosome condensation (RCC1) repeat [Carpediemonas membranifera]|eukprot:KAG9396125.1 Regulator of chromosome condensation (RCC1) repeat [Carpediemonas membranifera]
MGLFDSRDMRNKAVLRAAYLISLTTTASISGDIPSLLKATYTAAFHEDISAIPEIESTYRIGDDAADLLSLLSAVQLKPSLKLFRKKDNKALNLLNRSISILTDGSPLSMNVELAEGEELPVALHTLLQGTIWAILLQAGADPFLDMTPMEADQHRVDYKRSERCLWFLCKKFFFTYNVAGKEGIANTSAYNPDGFSVHQIYSGRLFKLLPTSHRKLMRVPTARITRIHSVSRFDSFIAQTPKGMWGWGYNYYGQLGVGSTASYVESPTRIRFSQACPGVETYEASLPAWRKSDLVCQLSMSHSRTFIATPAGLVVAGNVQNMLAEGVRANGTIFNHVPLPAHFIPDFIQDDMTVLLSMGDHQMITGPNWCGELGLGHCNDVTEFQPVPFRTDRVVASDGWFNIFLSGRRLLFAGEVPLSLSMTNLLPGLDQCAICANPVPLAFTSRISRFHCRGDFVCWVGEGKTHFYHRIHGMYTMPFEATRHDYGSGFFYDGVWVDPVLGDEGLLEPADWYEIEEMEVDSVSSDG